MVRPRPMLQCGASAGLRVLRRRYQGRGIAPTLLERRQSGDGRTHQYGHVHRLHRGAPRHGWRTAGQGSGRDCAGAFTTPSSGGLDHVRQTPELTACGSGDCHSRNGQLGTGRAARHHTSLAIDNRHVNPRLPVMRVFWSWQSDTHGKTGRHFVKECLEEARDTINQAVDLTEPTERDVVELDQDREGVVGHPDLANTIFGKIAAADVFVGDVTLVGELKIPVTPDNPEGIKKFINSNVAIEYGYAVGKLNDEGILLVMNLHYGPLTKLPFDLSHKVAPCRYMLAPKATKVEIAAARKSLTQQFVDALKLHIARVTPPPPPVVPFEPRPSTTNAATYWQPGEVLGSVGEPHPFRHSSQDSEIEYEFDPEQAFYLRLMPCASMPECPSGRFTSHLSRLRDGA
jgi:hypothetical protein